VGRNQTPKEKRLLHQFTQQENIIYIQGLSLIFVLLFDGLMGKMVRINSTLYTIK
jgi:hypothetical protein